MVDLLFIAEFSWCIIWLFTKRIYDGLLYAGGIVAAGYVAWMASGWVSKWFLGPTSHAFLWLQGHVQTDAKAVSALGWMIPAEPVSTGMQSSRWIALHVAHIFTFSLITVAVFLVFHIIAYLRRALWDWPHPREGIRARVAAGIVAFVASGYFVVLSAMLLSDLAWLRGWGWLVAPLHSSYIVQLVSQFVPNTLQSIFQ